MAISMVGWTTAMNDGAVSASIARPAGVAAGDLLLVFQSWSWEDNGSPATTPGAVPTGFEQWSQDISQDGTADLTSPMVRVSAKFATGSEPANYTWPTSPNTNNVVGMAAIRGVDQANPQALPTVWQITSNTPTQTLTGRTIPEANVAWVAFWAMQRFASPQTVTFTKPPEMALVGTVLNIYNLGAVTWEARNAGATGNRVATWSATQSKGRLGSIGLRTATTGTTYAKTGGAAGSLAGSGVDAVTPAAIFTKTGGAAAQAAGSGGKFITTPATHAETGGGAALAAGAGTSEVQPALVYDKTGGGAGELAGEGTKAIVGSTTYEKTGGAAGELAGEGTKVRQSGGEHVESGGGAGSLAGSGLHIVLKAVIHAKTGGGAGELAGSGEYVVTPTIATIYEKTGGGAGSLAGSGWAIWGPPIFNISPRTGPSVQLAAPLSFGRATCLPDKILVDDQVELV